MDGWIRLGQTLGLGCILWIASPAVAAVPVPNCSPLPSDPSPQIRSLISDGIAPLKDAYLNLNRFELDPLSANLVSLENETDPPGKRKTFSFSIRGGTGKRISQTRPTDVPINQSFPYSLNWQDGAATVTNPLVANANQILGTQFASTLSFSQDEIRKLSIEDFAAKLQSSFTASDASVQQMNGKIAAPRDYLMMASYLKLTAISGPEEFKSVSAEIGKHLTTAEKIRLVQTVAGIAGDDQHYDNVRAGHANSKDAKGNDDPGASKNYGNRVPAYAIVENLRDGKHLGICRDIAPMQAQLMKGLGFKDVYVLAYNPGGNHVDVLSRNPDNPKELLHFNYDHLEASDLRQGMRSVSSNVDYSTRYMIFTPEGKSVAVLPSELGTLLMEGEGGNVRDLDPFLYRPQGSIAKLSLDGKHSQFPVFVGQTTNGDQVVGVGNTIHYGDPNKNVVSMTSTFGAAYQSKNTSFYSDQEQKFDALHVNFTSAMAVNSHWTDLSKGKNGTLSGQLTTTTILHGDGTMSGITQYQKAQPEYPANKKRYDQAFADWQTAEANYEKDYAAWKIQSDDAKAKGLSEPPPPVEPTRPIEPSHPGVDYGASFSATTEIGANAKYVSANGNTKLNGRVATQLAVGSSNVSGLAVDRLYANVTYVRVSGEQVVIPDKLKATFNTALGLREFGPQVFLQGGVELPQNGIQASAGYQGALKGDAFTIAPGMEREFFADFEKQFKNSLILTASYQQPLGMSVGMVQVGAKGNLNQMLKKKKRTYDTD